MEQIGTQLERLSPPDHLAVTYRDRAEQFAVAAPFIRIGLARREKCVYVEGDVPASELLASMESLGIDPGAAVQSGALKTIPYPGPYIEDGRFDPGRMVQWHAQNDDDARRAGFSGYRCVAEMTWALGPYPGVDRLAEYEAQLNPFLVGRPMAVLCQYDRRFFPSEIIREVIATHPVVVACGRVCRNPYHVPAERYLSPDWPETEVDWLLESMSHLQSTDDALRESEERYRSLSRRLMEVQETERRSLALELHDELGQLLTAIRLTLRGRQRKGRIAEAVGLVDQAIEQVRTLALALRPAALDHLGLTAALQAYVERQAQRLGLEIRLDIGALEERLPADVEIAFFRVVQEALTNVIRHSGARRADVQLRADPGEILLVVRDDGQGFDVRAARSRAAGGASLGLLSMEERVAVVGGRLEVESEPGHGVTIRARFPRSPPRFAQPAP